jgi:hypothetical protein
MSYTETNYDVPVATPVATKKAQLANHKMREIDAMEAARGAYIHVLVPCPKKPGSIAERNWGIYGEVGKPTVTVAAFIRAYPKDDRGTDRARASLLWDWNRGFIAIGPVATPVDTDAETDDTETE